MVERTGAQLRWKASYASRLSDIYRELERVHDLADDRNNIFITQSV